MPRQNVEFEFPDPDKDETSQEVEIDIYEEEDAPLEIEGAVGREDVKSPKDTIKAGEVEIEVEDDTPEADRGRKASPPPEEVTNEELENYSDKVKNRIKHFSKGYHDERRAKEPTRSFLFGLRPLHIENRCDYRHRHFDCEHAVFKVPQSKTEQGQVAQVSK